VGARQVIVNAITFSRLPLVFLWLALALAGEYVGGFAFAVAALLALFLSGVSDFTDGVLARRWNVVTQLGKMADPLMDKAVYVVVFPAITWLLMHQNCTWHSLLMLAFTILYVLRDLWVTFMRSVAALFGGEVGAMKLGKVRTALTFPTAGIVYMYVSLRGLLPGEGRALFAYTCLFVELVMIAINLVSFAVYTRAYMPFLKRALERKRDL